MKVTGQGCKDQRSAVSIASALAPITGIIYASFASLLCVPV